ncbi:T9SS type A sorting domain-containing protein [Phaeodactylibacter xiamenensis]|uniref:T9SS type A sorting domain-containing protein n=1 Tax=Phaeodactylibacter xiamenensis TaxID=1524460 RepID=UPI003BAC5C7A
MKQQLSSWCLFFGLCTLVSAQSVLENEHGDPMTIRGAPAEYIGQHLRNEEAIIPAGDEVEGDYIGQMAFTADGAYVLVPHRQTNNISVIEWETGAFVADIPVGGSPIEITVMDTMAVVPCFTSNEAYLINLNDFSVAAVIPTGAQPTKARISRDGSTAAVACDEADVLEVIDLATLTKQMTIPGFNNYLYRFSLITSNPRNTLFWSGFELSPDGSLAVVGGEDALQFFDTQTGDLVESIPDVPNAGQISLSGDGTHLVAVSTGNEGQLSRIALETLSLVGQLSPPGSISSSYSSVAVNMDGTRAAVTGLSGTIYLARFDEGDVVDVSVTSSPNWIFSSADYQYAIGGQFYLSVIDFETAEIVGSSQGIPIQNGAVSPANNRMVATDPLRYEGLDYYEFEDPTSLNYLMRTPTGSPIEADASYSATLTPDLDRVLVANPLSGSLSVINLEEEALEALVPFSSEETYFAATDGAYAYVAKRGEDQVEVIDLETFEIVKTVSSGGDRPDQIYVLPGGDRAYVLNAGGVDRIGVLQQAGAGTSLEGSFASGNTGISWINYGLRSNLAIAKEGDYGVLATPFDDAVQIIDLGANEIIASVELENFPLRSAISDEVPGIGRFAAVTLRNGEGIAIITPIGPNAGLLDTYDIGGIPTRITYDATRRAFLICDQTNKVVRVFSIDNLSFEAPMSFSGGRIPISVAVDTFGVQHTLLRGDNPDQSNQLQIGEEVFELPGIPIHNMAVAPDGSVVAVPLIANDAVFVVKRTVVGTKAFSLPLATPSGYSVYPNPVTSTATFEWRDGAKVPNGTVTLRLFDATGKLVLQQDKLPAGQFTVRKGGLPAGTYSYQVMSTNRLQGYGKLVIR